MVNVFSILQEAHTYNYIKSLASIPNDFDLLTKMRETAKMEWLKNIVMYSSGPVAVMLGAFDGTLIYKRDTISEKIEAFSFARYGLNSTFTSNNSYSFHTSSKDALSKAQKAELGTSNDLSWLEIGQNAMSLREKKIENAALTIQKIYRGNKDRKQLSLPTDIDAMRDKIQTHITKIDNELHGFFGFYRRHQRSEKIKALNGILSHFNENQFDTSGFKNALPLYCSKEVFASIGTSKTKTLINELNLFSRQAKLYKLTSDTGLVDIKPLKVP